MSVRAGSGVVVARLPEGGWSAPAEMLVAGLGGGFNAGAEMVDLLIVINTNEMLRSFLSSGSLHLGGNASLSVGPLGRHGEIDASISADGKVSGMYSYSQSRGLYGGISIEGTALQYFDRNNEVTYGKGATPKMILTGKYPSPPYAVRLTRTLERITGWAPGSVNEQNMGDYMYDDDASDISVPDDNPFGDRYGQPEMMDSLDRELHSSKAERAPRTAKAAAADPFADETDQYADEFGENAGPMLGRSKYSAYAPGVAEAAAPRASASSEPSANADNYDVDDELVVALYDFEAQQPSDLSFRRGDIIRVLSSTESQEGWWRGEIRRGGRTTEGVCVHANKIPRKLLRAYIATTCSRPFRQRPGPHSAQARCDRCQSMRRARRRPSGDMSRRARCRAAPQK